MQSMHPNITALTKVLGKLALPFSFVEGFPDALHVRNHFFIRLSTPFNTQSVGALVKDKSAVHAMLARIVPMPKTRRFIDPLGRTEFREESSIDEIVQKASDFLYPRIVKMNKGERGAHVFIVSNDAEARAALETVFDRRSKNYDYIALVQEYVEPAREIRVAISCGKPAFAYDRESREIFRNGRMKELSVLSGRITEALGLSWGSVDFIESKDGRLFFLEANTKPSYEGFISVHGDTLVQSLYESALKDFFGR